MAGTKRKLAAILSADVVGYSRLMADDEPATVATLKEFRSKIEQIVGSHNGRIVNAPGDNILAEFASAVEAIQGAVEIQNTLEARNARLAAGRAMQFRVGVNLGDVIEEDDGSIYGDGVNIAARMESLADPGGICISSSVYDAIVGKVEFGFDFLGKQKVKNIDRPIQVYRLRAGEKSVPRSKRTRPRHLSWAFRGALIALFLSAVPVGWWIVTKVSYGPGSGVDTGFDSAAFDGPSIAVLPFVNLGGDTAQDYFGRGLAGEILTQLSLVREFRVISRASSARFSGEEIDARQVAEELGVEYLLVGSVQRSTDTLRVSTELIDAATGNQLWAKRFDRSLSADDLFDIQDEITNQVVATIADEYGVISQITRQRSQGVSSVSLRSYECVLLGYEYFEQKLSSDHLRARDCLEAAVEENPEYAEAWGWLAILYGHEFVWGFNPRPNPLERALDAGETGIAADPSSQMAWEGLAAAHFFRHEFDAFVASADRAVALNPNDVSTIANIGFYYGCWGEMSKARPLLERALGLSPFPVWWYYWPFWQEAVANESFDAALDYAHKSSLPNLWWTHLRFVVAYAELDRINEAKTELERLLEMRPNIAQSVRDDLRFWNTPESTIAAIVRGLEKAGLAVAEEPPQTN